MGKASLSIPHDQPRASSRINDNYCVTKLRARLLAGSTLRETLTVQSIKTHVNLNVVNHVPSTTGHPQRKGISPGLSVVMSKDYTLKLVKGASSVIQLPCVQPVTNVPLAVQNLPVGSRLQNFWQTWLEMGAGPKIVQNLKEGYTLPFRIRPNLIRSPTVISCYVNPYSNSYLLETLHQLIDKNAIELVHNQTSPGFFNRLFLVPKPVEAYTGPKQTKSFPQGGEIQNGDTGNHQDIPPARGVGNLSRLQGCLLPYTNTGTVQEISQISCPGPDLPIQSTTIWSVDSAHEVHCVSKGGETDGHTQGYKNPPVPRRLVGKSQIPPNLSPSHPNPGQDVPGSRLAGEFGKIRTGAQASLQLCRLPVQPQVRPGQADTGPVAKSSRKDTSTVVTTGLSGPAVHVLDRSVNSHRKTSSPRPITHETHTVASQEQLEGTKSLEKVIPQPTSLHPHLQWWLEESLCSKVNHYTP